jgi:hypothetical protein
MNVIRVLLSLFAIVNVAFWAILAWVWAAKPTWAARVPLGLGTDPRYLKAPAWARLAAAVAAFWSVAATLYLAKVASDPLAFIILFVLAAIFLILGIGAASRVYKVLQMGPTSPSAPNRQQRAQ